MPLEIVFRCDASATIGSGHVMRCLTLANGLRGRGCAVSFITRNFDDNGDGYISEAGFEVLSLPVYSSTSWLGADPDLDAEECVGLLADVDPDWLVVDHYEIDAKWHEMVKRKSPDLKIMVLDDLADRAHSCDILSDSAYGRQRQTYSSLVNENTRLLLGSDYALLRDEFSERREVSLERRMEKLSDANVLVTLGGGDVAGPMSVVAEALKELSKTLNFRLTVVEGGVRNRFRNLFQDIDNKIEILNRADDMALRMEQADICIGAGGGTTWERCCLGLPTVVLTLADNQREIVSVLEDENAAVACGIKAEEISSSIERLLRDDDFRKSIAARASELCDGGGSKRVVRELLTSSIMLRKARSDDAVFVYKARYDDDAHRYYRSQNKPDLDGHVSWFETALSDSRRQLLIARISETDVGHVRFDFEKGNDQVAEIGIAISSAHRGKGLAVPILVQSTRYFASNGGKTIKAEVYRDNPVSQRAFEAAGFMFQTEDEDGFRQFEWNSDQLM